MVKLGPVEHLMLLTFVDKYSNYTYQDLSTALMNLARTDFESGVISRPEFLAQVASLHR